MIFFALDNCIMLQRHMLFVARPGKVKSGGYLSVPTNIHRNKIGCISETLIFQALKLPFWRPKCHKNCTRAYWITNLATHKLVYTLTDTSNCTKDYLPAHLPNPTSPLPSPPFLTIFTFFPSAKKLWM